MSIINWNPFNEIEEIQSSINRVFNDDTFARTKKSKNALDLWKPVLDILEKKDGYSIKTEIPGIPKEYITIDVSNAVLTIKGEKKQETEKEDSKYSRKECAYGLFQRQLVLPKTIDANKIKANYKNGILELFIPKGKEKEAKKITIE